MNIEMDSLERAKIKDNILRFLLRNRNCEYIRFYVALGKPTKQVDDFLNLGLEIYRYEPYIINIHSFYGQIQFDGTELTSIFLENGGFTAIEEERRKNL